MLLRKIVTNGTTFADTDWLDPAQTPPDNSRPFIPTGGPIFFALRGRASTADDAAMVSLGSMRIDAYLALEQPGGGMSRDHSISESDSQAIDSQILLATNDIPRTRSRARIHVTLSNVSAPVVEITLISGARVV